MQGRQSADESMSMQQMQMPTEAGNAKGKRRLERETLEVHERYCCRERECVCVSPLHCRVLYEVFETEATLIDQDQHG